MNATGIYRLVARVRKSRAGDVPKVRLRCNSCGVHIHRHDRYTIVVAKHRDCRDPKLVG